MVLLAGAAQADERFDKLDYDRDGRLSLAEVAGNADLVMGFDKFDRNKDGKLSVAEYDRLTRPKSAEAAPQSATGSTSKPRSKPKKK
jgi:hypothetical protein